MYASKIYCMIIAQFGLILAQKDCTYEFYGSKFDRRRAVRKLTDGAVWWLDDSALHLRFNGTRVLHRFGAKTKTQRDLYLSAYDVHDQKYDRFLRLKPGQDSPRETSAVGALMVKEVRIRGINRTHLDDADFVSVIACPEYCPKYYGCFGACSEWAWNGCIQCLCPEGSMSAGCAGHTDTNLRLLMAFIKMKTPGCQYVSGYRRVILVTESFSFTVSSAFLYSTGAPELMCKMHHANKSCTWLRRLRPIQLPTLYILEETAYSANQKRLYESVFLKPDLREKTVFFLCPYDIFFLRRK